MVKKKESRKGIPNEAKYIKRRLEQTNRKVMEEHKYQDMLLKEKKRLNAGKAIEIEPSKSLYSLLEKRQKEKEKDFADIKVGPAGPRATLYPYPEPIFPFPGSYSWSRLVCCLEEFSRSILDPRYYLDLLEGTGYSGASQLGGLNEKQASGFAGTAALVGPNVHPVNEVIIGFGSGFSLTGTGQEIAVIVRSWANVHYPWLEAQCFSADSMGHVMVESSLNVTVGADELYEYDSETLISSYATINSTPWHPVGMSSAVNRTVELTITLPPGVSKYIDIYEAIWLKAIRYGDPNWCNAVVQCSATFSPVVVNIFKKC